MNSPLDKYQEWTRDVIGEKLLGVRGLIYALETPDYGHPQQLQFIFSQVGKINNLKCGKDGSTLELSDRPLRENDLGEYGKEMIVDISSMPPFINYLEKRLLKVSLVFSSLEDAVIGIKLIFEDSLSLFIMNIGDELNILESLSSSYEEDEGIKYQQV